MEILTKPSYRLVSDHGFAEVRQHLFNNQNALFALQSFQSGARRLLKASLLSLRGIATVTFMFLVVTAIYELLLRIVGNQPPFFLLAALVTASMYVFILAYCLVDYAKELRGTYREQ